MYEADHDFAPLIRYLNEHPGLEHRDWQYMGHEPYRYNEPVAVYRARETVEAPLVTLRLLTDGRSVLEEVPA